MAKRKEITWSFYIGDKKVDKLPEDYLKWMSGNLTREMSLYYRQHPEEYKKLLESDEGKTEAVDAS